MRCSAQILVCRFPCLLLTALTSFRSSNKYEVVTMVLRCVHDSVDGLPELATSSARAQLPVAPHTYTGTYQLPSPTHSLSDLGTTTSPSDLHTDSTTCLTLIFHLTVGLSDHLTGYRLNLTEQTVSSFNLCHRLRQAGCQR